MAETTALKNQNIALADATEGGGPIPISSEVHGIVFKGVKKGNKEKPESSDDFVTKELIKKLLIVQEPDMSMELVRNALEFIGYQGDPIEGEFPIQEFSQFGEMRVSADGKTTMAYSKARSSSQNKVLSAPSLDEKQLAILSQEIVILEDYDIPTQTIEMVAITENKYEQVNTGEANQSQQVSGANNFQLMGTEQQPQTQPQTPDLSWMLNMRPEDIIK